jgi:transcriptional regulator with XRE-family HTH domain
MDEAGVSQRELARRLAGGEASSRRRENVRRQVAKWLNGTRPGLENAEKLAKVLKTPEDYFVTERRDRADELAELREAFDELRLELQGRVDRLEKRLERQARPRGARGVG